VAIAYRVGFVRCGHRVVELLEPADGLVYCAGSAIGHDEASDAGPPAVALRSPTRARRRHCQGGFSPIPTVEYDVAVCLMRPYAEPESAEQIARVFQVFWEKYSAEPYVSRQHMDFI
jgi:hypothetical protein